MNDSMAVSSSTDGTFTIYSIPKDLKLQPVHTFSNPATKTLDGVMISGILQLEYNASLNEILTLGDDRHVTFWSVDKREMIR